MRHEEINRLGIILGSEGVADYRIERAAKNLGGFSLTRLGDIYGGGREATESAQNINANGGSVSPYRMKALADWLARIGFDWEVFWTNHYAPDSQIVQDMMRDHGVPVAVDVDDWFEEIPWGNEAFKSWWGMKRRWYKSCLEEADRVVCSTPILADKYGGEVAPNFVDPAEWDWPMRKSKNPEECVVLCAGGIGRAGDYLEREPEFKAMLELPNVKFVFMGGFPEWALDYPAGKVIWTRWVPYEHYKRVVRWIAPDVFVSPLQRNIFNEAKSNLKWLEAGMLDSVFVGERWGEYARTVTDGVDGVLADSREEWSDKLRWLAVDPDERKKIAAANRKSVEQSWVWDSVRHMWERAILGKGVRDGTGRERAAGNSDQLQHAAAAG